MDTIALHSRVPAKLLRKTLFRGSFLAITGGLIICITGAFLPATKLAIWGPLLFGASIGLITLGLCPYRRLMRIQQNPHTLLITSNEIIEYRDHSGRLRLTIPFSTITNIRFLKQGIGLSFHSNPPTPITLHHPPMDIESIQKKIRTQTGCDLLLPLFDEKSYKELRECLFTAPEE